MWVNQGLIGHQMSGFDAAKASELFNISDDFQPISVSAFGYYGDPEMLPADMKKTESKPRERKTIDEMLL